VKSKSRGESIIYLVRIQPHFPLITMFKTNIKTRNHVHTKISNNPSQAADHCSGTREPSNCLSHRRQQLHLNQTCRNIIKYMNLANQEGCHLFLSLSHILITPHLFVGTLGEGFHLSFSPLVARLIGLATTSEPFCDEESHKTFSMIIVDVFLPTFLPVLPADIVCSVVSF
jgi:hypothetical protein